jgi:hypothetical protein
MPIGDPRSSVVSSLSSRLLALALILTATGIVCGVVRAQEKAKLPGDDWIPLIQRRRSERLDQDRQRELDGRGWVDPRKRPDQDYGYLQTDKDYKDFQLSLRFKCVGDGNSGVFFHSEFKPGTADVTQGNAV